MPLTPSSNGTHRDLQPGNIMLVQSGGNPRKKEISSSLTWRLALLLMSSAPALAQSEVPVFKVETNLQSIAVRVTDRQGNDVHGLSAEDFTLLENGRSQKIAFFGVDYEPLSLTILIDSSSSMESGGKLDRARTVFGPPIRGKSPRRRGVPAAIYGSGRTYPTAHQRTTSGPTKGESRHAGGRHRAL